MLQYPLSRLFRWLPIAAPARAVLFRLGLGLFLPAAGSATAAAVTGATALRLPDAVPRRELDFELVELVPLRIRAIPLRNREQFTQATAGIGGRRGRRGRGLFLIHVLRHMSWATEPDTPVPLRDR